MKSPVGIEREFLVPVWSSKLARELLEDYAWKSEKHLPTGLTKIEWEEEFFILFNKYKVTVYGDAMFVKAFLEELARRIKAF